MINTKKKIARLAPASGLAFNNLNYIALHFSRLVFLSRPVV
jgi:hypothetical protein